MRLTAFPCAVNVFARTKGIEFDLSVAIKTIPLDERCRTKTDTTVASHVRKAIELTGRSIIVGSISNEGSVPKPEAEPLYVDGDGLRPGYRWRIDEYGQAGALTKNQQDTIESHFKLPHEDVMDLSWRLGHALDLNSGGRLVPISRSKAGERATDALKKSEKNCERAAIELTTALERIEVLDTSTSDHPDGAAELRRVEAKLAELLLEIASIRSNLDHVVEHQGVAHDVVGIDKRNVHDVRRRLVLDVLFTVWAQSGRSLTVTTDPIENSRKGPLLDFVKMVTGFLIDPSPRTDVTVEQMLGDAPQRAPAAPPELPPETIVADLARFKKQNLDKA